MMNYAVVDTNESSAEMIEIIDGLAEHEFLEKLERSREHAAQGALRDAEAVSRDIRTK